jgi:hypothetical protein
MTLEYGAACGFVRVGSRMICRKSRSAFARENNAETIVLPIRLLYCTNVKR